MQKLIRKLIIFLLIMFFITFVGCASKYKNNSIDDKVDLSGTWIGTVTPVEKAGAMKILINHYDDNISGQIIFQDKLGKFANINGKILCNQISGTYLLIPDLGEGCFNLEFIGNKMNGTWYRTDGVPSSGTCSLIKQQIN